MDNEKGVNLLSSGTEEVSPKNNFQEEGVSNSKPTWLDKWHKVREAPPPELEENDEDIKERVAKAVTDRREACVPTEVPFGQFRRGD